MALVRLALVLLLIGMGPSVVRGQSSDTSGTAVIRDTLVQRVSTAFADGSAQRLLTPSADRVEVGLFGTNTFYSNAQAFYVLRDFFDTHPPADFAVGDVTEAGNSFFVRGQFDHNRDARTLQVYVRLVQREEAWELQEVRINADIE